MKITILDTIPGEEDEIIIKCQNLSEDIQNLLQKLKQGNTKIADITRMVSICWSRMKSIILRQSTTKCLPVVKRGLRSAGEIVYT